MINEKKQINNIIKETTQVEYKEQMLENDNNLNDETITNDTKIKKTTKIGVLSNIYLSLIISVLNFFSPITIELSILLLFWI